MKKVFKGLCLILLVSWASHIVAQNPKQTQKHKKKNSKEEKKEWLKGSYTPTAADADGDGVQNFTDKCPGTPKGQKVTPFGCPVDADFDGIYDFEDACPDQKGPFANRGCPWGDKDNDGISDDIDKCPEYAGVKKFNGCPDTDHDGIMDSEDLCPQQFGVPETKGCPPEENDTDGDGLYDHEDLCPKVSGLRENKGCPALSAVEKKALDKAFDNLLFESGKDIILKSSYPSLDALAIMLKNKPQYKLFLEGHTDNVGNDNHNLVLSQQRSLSTKTYLVSKGVEDARITTGGKGELKPKGSNDTETGRKLNRRVEMTIIME